MGDEQQFVFPFPVLMVRYSYIAVEYLLLKIEGTIACPSGTNCGHCANSLLSTATHTPQGNRVSNPRGVRPTQKGIGFG